MFRLNMCVPVVGGGGVEPAGRLQQVAIQDCFVGC
jgi:hypothetical protein